MNLCNSVIKQTTAQLLGTPCIRTLELPWVPCSPQALGKELELSPEKAGRTPQHTGLELRRQLGNRIAQIGAHSHHLIPLLMPPCPAHPHSSFTQPGAQASLHALPFELDLPIPSFLHLHMAASPPQHLQRQAMWAGLGWAEMGMASFSHPPKPMGAGAGRAWAAPAPAE